MGFSQGGGVALQVALRHPTLVNKLVSLSATYRRDGWYPSVFEGIEDLSATAFAGTPVEKAFMEHTPDTTAFDAYVKKMRWRCSSCAVAVTMKRQRQGCCRRYLPPAW